MTMSISMDTDQYESLVGLARLGATTAEAQRQATDLFIAIELQNGITRYCLWVQWQEINQPLPPGTTFPSNWPPTLRFRIERIGFPISKIDVQTVLRARASNPVYVLVTPDPGGELGWTAVDSYFAS